MYNSKWTLDSERWWCANVGSSQATNLPPWPKKLMGEGGCVRQTDCGCKNSVLFITFCWGVLEIHNSQHGIPRTFELKRNERLQNCFRVEDSCFSPQVQTESIWSFLCKSFIFCMALVLTCVSKNSSHLSICKFDLRLADSI